LCPGSPRSQSTCTYCPNQHLRTMWQMSGMPWPIQSCHFKAQHPSCYCWALQRPCLIPILLSPEIVVMPSVEESQLCSFGQNISWCTIFGQGQVLHLFLLQFLILSSLIQLASFKHEYLVESALPLIINLLMFTYKRLPLRALPPGSFCK
jgi:hypothetical protein